MSEAGHSSRDAKLQEAAQLMHMPRNNTCGLQLSEHGEARAIKMHIYIYIYILIYLYVYMHIPYPLEAECAPWTTVTERHQRTNHSRCVLDFDATIFKRR